MRYEDLAALSAVVRKEVLTGEFSRRVKAMDTVAAQDVEPIVDALVNLSLGEVVQGIQDPAKLAEQVTSIKNSLKPARSTPDKSPSPSASQDSRLLGPNALNATASAPEHPSTPISISASLSTPPRTSSPSGSVPPTSERDRIMLAVSKFESTRQGELTDLLMSLPKRERAMCLFNVEVLRAKIADAKNVLDSDDSPADVPEASVSVKPAPPVAHGPPTPQAKKFVSNSGNSPQTPDLSSRGPSAAASPVPGTPGGSTTATTHTIASLARLPAVEIIKIAQSSSATGLPLPKADPDVVQATDEFMDSLLDRPIQTQKQQLGDKL
jgi:polyadenylate-binding protein